MSDLGIRRKPPRGWVPARAFAVQHRSHEQRRGDSEGSEFDTSRQLEVEWEIRVDGQEPYRFAEVRKAPLWVNRRHVGAGKRWFSVRPKRTYGLMSSVGLPCHVDPDDAHGLWIDWDAAYDLHEPAWKEHSAAAPERRSAERERLQHEDAAVVARANAQPVDADTAALREVSRLYGLGVTGSATVVSASATGRAVKGVSVWRFELELESGRLVTMEQAVPSRSLSSYSAGSRITVYTDPGNPEAIALG